MALPKVVTLTCLDEDHYCITMVTVFVCILGIIEISACYNSTHFIERKHDHLYLFLNFLFFLVFILNCNIIERFQIEADRNLSESYLC